MTGLPRDERVVLAIDLGTGGPKVGLVTLHGVVRWEEHHAVTTRLLPDGGAVQDAEEWWQVVTAAARDALASGVVDPAAVVAVAITGQWASVVPTGEDGRPVGDVILWMDTRGRHHVRRVIGGPVAGYAPASLATWIRTTGGAPSTHGGDPVSHLLLLQSDLPEVAAAARWFLEPVDHLTMRFTGVASATHASMTGAWLTDNRRLDVLRYDPRLLALAGLDDTKLPPLRPPGTVVGTVQPEVATELGLPPGVRVVTGMPDLHASAVGSGAIGLYEGHLSISTTSWISAPVPFKKTDVLHAIASIPGVRPGTYLIANNHETSGRALEWCRDVLSSGRAEPLGYAALDQLAATAAPGSGGVVFTPWLNGERSPVDDRTARGGFQGLSLATTQADLVRAVLEGVALNDRWLLGYVERFAKRRLDPIRMIGGGARSDLWCQIHADVLDRTIERVADPLRAGLRGVALLAGMALGDIRPEEVRGLVRVDRTFRPDPATRSTYDRLAAEWPRRYQAQKGLLGRLAGTD